MTEQEKALAGNSKGFLSEETYEDLPPAGEATAAARLGPIIVPNVRLKGMAWMENAELQVTLEGPISVDLARAAVKELFPPWAPREETKRFITP